MLELLSQLKTKFKSFKLKQNLIDDEIFQPIGQRSGMIPLYSIV